MKNLSLQMSDVATLKKSADAVSKSNANVESSSSTESNASFQMMLNKQVQATHASTQNAQAKQAQAQNNIAKKTTAKESESITAKTESVDTGTAQKNAQKASHLQLVMTATNHTKAIQDVEITSVTQMVPKDSIEIDDKTKPLKKSDEDSKSEGTATITTDGNLAVIPSSPVILPIANIDNKQVAQSTLNPSAELAANNAAPSEKHRSLGAEIGAGIRDYVLNNALSQGKNSNQSEAQDIATGDDKQPQNSWLEAMLPDASAKPMSSDDTAKIMLNAVKEGASKELSIKDLSIKESVNKEAALPVNFQSTTQINTTEAIQQIGSSNVINAYPGKTGWDQAISQKVVWMLGAQEQSATLTLNPPDMGPLQVVIHVHNDQADTTFISDNAEVRQALQDGMANLREKMNESGIQLGQANVNSGSQMQQQFQQAAQQNSPASQQRSVTEASQVVVSGNSQRGVSVTNGLVDTFA